MPLYEYECLRCARRTERIESFSGPHLKKCPHCGGKVERLLAAPAIQLKGGGWYVTDYAHKGGPSSDKSERPGPKEAAETAGAKDSKLAAKKKTVLER